MRTISTALPLTSRLLFLAEMLGGLIFLAWLIKSKRLSEVSDAERNWLWTILRIGTRIAAVVFLAAFIANALGYVSIAGLVGNAVLGSAYVAIILFAAVKIADGLIMFILRIHPISLLGMVRSHRRLRPEARAAHSALDRRRFCGRSIRLNCFRCARLRPRTFAQP